ncbi:MutS protein msh5, partial [Ascosphaera aggregata]
VDLTASAEEGRTVINPDVDPGLDELKHFYCGLESLLSQVAIDIATTLPEDAKSSINVIYFPQLGFNIAIALRDGRPIYDGTEEGWEKVFVTENRAYFKDDRMREMDDKLGDVYGHICEREIEITYELAQRVLENEVKLSDASEACGELDSILALVHGAKLYKFTRPKMVEDNIIDIKGGSFVPADAASIGLTDKILTRVTTRETVTKVSSDLSTAAWDRNSFLQARSSFMLDLEQISIALNSATHRSLIIIDEFGKGTESSDGAGLACGLFEYLLGLGNERPRVLGATHFHEIFETGFLVQRPHLAFGHMEIQINPASHDLEDQITYLYNKVSFGMNCAAMNGIDGEILRRARDLTDLAANGEDLGAACARISKEEMMQLKEAV